MECMHFIVSFKSPTIDRHVVLGQLDAWSYMDAHDKVLKLLVKNGVDPYDIYPTKTYCAINLRDGTFVDIHPLVPFEDWVNNIAEAMKSGPIVDIQSNDYSITSGALAKC